jgi:cell fate regulator YaaT (PSP1 superfamily)
MSDIVQVSLRGSRKDFFLNSRNLWLALRDRVVVQTDHGEALGTVFLKDPTLVSLKRPGTVTREIIRKAEEEDLDREDHLKALERDCMQYGRERIALRELRMDLSEVEAAFGGGRITFYFIELRQIGVRDQARRLDGCGPCGRAFCCSTWLKDFHPVTLKMAREQQLSLNPAKISGACGRLLCCLAYELAQYRDSAARLPAVGAEMKTGKGPVKVTRVEVYPEAIWIRDAEGAEHRLTYDMLPPGPYHQCGDCGCGKKKNGGRADAH